MNEANNHNFLLRQGRLFRELALQSHPPPSTPRGVASFPVVVRVKHPNEIEQPPRSSTVEPRSAIDSPFMVELPSLTLRRLAAQEGPRVVGCAQQPEMISGQGLSSSLTSPPVLVPLRLHEENAVVDTACARIYTPSGEWSVSRW